LAKLPKHQEFVKRNSRRGRYAKQAANVRARRASLKQREMAIPTDSMSSWVRGDASSRHAGGTQGEIKAATPRVEDTTTLAYWPPHKRASSNHFEVFSSMPVSVEEATCNTSDTSSASTHFKRKKPRKQILVGHRPVTQSLTNSSNSRNNTIYVGSYNPLFDDYSNIENELLDTAGSADLNPLNGEDPQASSEDGSPSPHSESEPGDVEQVLATNEGQSVVEQMNRMMDALQQKEEELAVLREQVANTRNHTSDVNASTSHNGSHPHPNLKLHSNPYRG